MPLFANGLMTKTIFITGGSRGIGEAVVRRSAGKYNVAFTYSKSEKKALDLQNELAQFGGVMAIKCDVEDKISVQNAVEIAKKRFGKIDVVVNNAGIAKSGLFIDVTDDDWKQIFSVNVDGVRNVTKAILPDMLSGGEGAIVNVSSIWGEIGASMEVVYSATKGAIISLTKALAKEVAPSGVTVNAVAPGAINTDMMSCYTQEEIDVLCNEIPLGRLGEPREVADAILFLAENKYITGAVLDINGGWN